VRERKSRYSWSSILPAEKRIYLIIGERRRIFFFGKRIHYAHSYILTYKGARQEDAQRTISESSSGINIYIYIVSFCLLCSIPLFFAVVICCK